MVFGNGVKNIQATAYNGTREVYDDFSARTRQQQMTFEQQCTHTLNWQCCIKTAACVSIKAKMQFSILVTLAHWDSKKYERLDFIQKSVQSKDGW